jgi:hypothetical protein
MAALLTGHRAAFVELGATAEPCEGPLGFQSGVAYLRVTAANSEAPCDWTVNVALGENSITVAGDGVLVHAGVGSFGSSCGLSDAAFMLVRVTAGVTVETIMAGGDALTGFLVRLGSPPDGGFTDCGVPTPADSATHTAPCDQPLEMEVSGQGVTVTLISSWGNCLTIGGSPGTNDCDLVPEHVDCFHHHACNVYQTCATLQTMSLGWAYCESVPESDPMKEEKCYEEDDGGDVGFVVKVSCRGSGTAVSAVSMTGCAGDVAGFLSVQNQQWWYMWRAQFSTDCWYYSIVVVGVEEAGVIAYNRLCGVQDDNLLLPLPDLD